jgi:Fic family protein
LRNVASSLLIEGVPIELADAERALDTGRASDSAERSVLRMAEVYGSIAGGRLPPLTVDGLRSIHRRLFEGVFDPRQFLPAYIGRLKPVENVVAIMGVAIFHPTPPDRVKAELEALLSWVQDNRHVMPPPLLAGIAHAEFEAIHPFADGNGRVGRLLNHVIMKACRMENISAVPIDEGFYLGRESYYELLSSTETRADYAAWCRYFTEKVAEAYAAAESSGFGLVHDGLPHGAAQDVYRWVMQGERGRFSSSDIPNPRNRSPTAIRRALRELRRRGILEATGKAKGRRYRVRREFLEARRAERAP